MRDSSSTQPAKPMFELLAGEGTDQARSDRRSKITCIRYSKITAGSYHVEGESGGKVRMALTLNETCRIANVCDGRRREAVPKVGSVSILPPGMRYAQTITGVASALLFEFSWSEIAEWISREIPIDPARIQLQTRICVQDDALARGLFSLAMDRPGGRDEHMHGVMDRLVSSHSNRAKPIRRKRFSGGLTPLQLRRVEEAVEARAVDGLSLDDMADEAGLSKFHFIRAFSTTVGTTPHRYVMDRKLAWAVTALLDRRLDVEEVAERLGFSHASHLSRLLRRHFGMTPSDFRRAVFPQTSCGVDVVA